MKPFLKLRADIAPENGWDLEDELVSFLGPGVFWQVRTVVSFYVSVYF